MKLLELFEARSPTRFTVLDVVRDILGKDKVATSTDDMKPGVYLVKQADEPGFTPPKKGQVEDWMAELGLTATDIPGTIYLVNLNSRDAADVAQAAHEAYHAWMTVKSPGKIYQNEKFTNQLATKWLKKNLSGVELHAALEMILKSKISYGHN
ncbi:hypothetical protein [Acinetobacter sp.]|uniref:hypothetical protein n=1 Tax=Acinetobacter sp. TaxID=472 RepID=UPI00388DD7EF